jgi:ATP-binding cassette, subfamily B, bacterial
MKQTDLPSQTSRVWFNLREAVVLVWRAAPRWMTVTVVLAPLLALLPLLILYFFKLIIDRVVEVVGNDGATEWTVVGGLFGWVAGFAVLQEGLRALGAYAEAVTAEQVLDHVHARLHRKSVAVDLAYYEQAEYHNTLYRAQREAAYRPVQVLKHLVLLGQSALSLMGVAILLTTLHWGVSLVLAASTLPGLLVRLRYAGKHYLRQRAWTPTDRLSWYFHELMTGASFAKEVRLFDLGAWLQRRYAALRKDVREDRLAFTRRRAGAELVAQVSASLAMFGSLAWAASLALAGRLTVGGLVLYFQAFQRGLSSLRELLSALAGVHESSLFLADFHDFLALENFVNDPAFPQPIPTPMREGIRFENVVFGYPGNERRVLSDVSLEIAPGETIALVGMNGAGKTTLIKLLCRLYDPTSGRITVDGIDLRSLTVVAWRRQIDVLFQDYSRYNLSVRENIALADDTLDLGRVTAAAHAAGASEAIARLPNGFETVLGNEYVDGSLISGGEWQKVALARTFLRESPIVVLDEPTSSIDAESESEILRHFRQLMRGRTAILISHRLAFAREVDRIYVLGEGRIIESGNHTALMARNGSYARMFTLQASRYQENSTGA